MPEFTFTGATGRHYPESRDALGVPIGEVEPGDKRDLNGPLDGDWLPASPPAGEKAAPKAKDGPKAAAKAADTDTKAGATGEKG